MLFAFGVSKISPITVVDSFFFFQAEDGIRDLTVTGVQTCALPIFSVFRRQHPLGPGTVGEQLASAFLRHPGGHQQGLGFELTRRAVAASRPRACSRSEERRVGKECRSRWSPYH